MNNATLVPQVSCLVRLATLTGLMSACEKKFFEPAGSPYERKLQGMYAYEADEVSQDEKSKAADGSDDEGDAAVDESVCIH